MSYQTMGQADPDRACTHQDFVASVEVNRLTDTSDGPVTAYSASVRAWCANCAEQFRWIGLRAGSSGTEPMCSVDETELLAPLRPASSDPDFGLGIPGYAIQQVTAGDPTEAAPTVAARIVGGIGPRCPRCGATDTQPCWSRWTLGERRRWHTGRVFAEARALGAARAGGRTWDEYPAGRP